jgi:CreA protein
MSGELVLIKTARVASAVLFAALMIGSARADDGPDLIFRESTKFRLITPNDKLATYAIDDPLIDGVACYYTVPEKGGLTGAFGLAEETSDVSLACRQYGAIKFKDKFSQGDTAFAARRSVLFKHMQIVRGCDPKRNVLVYMVYTDKLIDGSPKNSTSTVPVQPWGGAGDAPRCADFLIR